MDVVGKEVAEFLLDVVAPQIRSQDGLPDLFVFREDRPNDPKVRFEDPHLWFWVEVKGAGESIRNTQKRFWRLIADRPDLGLGPERLRLFRALPSGSAHNPRSWAY
jgi:hypothetical protein